MKPRILEHGLSLALVTLLMVVALVVIRSTRGTEREDKKSAFRNFLSIPGAELTDPFQKTLLKETLNIYYPGQEAKNDSTLKALFLYRQGEFEKMTEQSQAETDLSFGRFLQIAGMYFKFLIVYLLVMAFTYYGVQTLAVWRFVSLRRDETGNRFTRVFLAAGKLFACLILFSPSYVIAYSIRTEFNTDTLPFMVLLGVVSNGLLITYANKFYHFLVTESRKGYVETAIVKNLANGYSADAVDGISRAAVLRLRKRFDGHVFGHIFRNAHLQYLTAVKEQAAFLVTGLVIIEMALNIHGCYNYEMLRQMLYRNYDIALIFFLGIFYTVKATELLADIIHHREMAKYENA